MAKGIYCLECGHLEAFDITGAVTRCKCFQGPVVGWWVDQRTVTAQMAVLPPGDRAKARVWTILNRFLRADVETIPPGVLDASGHMMALPPDQVDQQWRTVKDRAIQVPPKPEAFNIFPRRQNVIVITQPGTTPDTHWATEPELLRRGLLQTTRA